MVKTNNFFKIGDTKQPYERLFKSPVFSFSNDSSIASNGFFLIDYFEDKPATRKYGAFNNLRIANNSSQDILIYPNQKRADGGILIPAGTIQNVDSGAVPNTTSILIENIDGGTISANELRVNVWKNRADFENAFERVHRKFFTNKPKLNFGSKLRGL